MATVQVRNSCAINFHLTIDWPLTVLAYEYPDVLSCFVDSEVSPEIADNSLNLMFDDDADLIPTGTTSFQFAYVLSEDGLAPYLVDSDVIYIIAPVYTVSDAACAVIIEVMKPVALVQAFVVFDGVSRQVRNPYCVPVDV